MQSISISMHISIDFQTNFDFVYMNPSSWLQTNGMILSLDELINDHTKSRMHELNLCISNRDLVKPSHIQLSKAYCHCLWYF